MENVLNKSLIQINSCICHSSHVIVSIENELSHRLIFIRGEK